MSKQAPALVIFLMLLTVASVSGLPGFMVAHAGTAGGHLLSVAANTAGAPLWLHADMLFTDGTLQPYNHHPPLFFWLQSLVIWPFHTALARLTAAHYFSATISATTLGFLYLTLRHLGLRQWPAALGVTAVAGTRMYATYRGFITFDILSPFLATLFLLTITRLESSPTPRHIRNFLLAGMLALLISWYSITIIAAYLSTRILLSLRHGLRATLTGWPLLCALALGAFFVTEVSLLLLQEYLATNTLASLTGALARQSQLNTGAVAAQSHLGTLTMLARRMLETLPLLPLILAAIPLAAYARPIASSILPNPATRAALAVTGGTILFIALTPAWSKVHPFAFLWLLPPIGLATALLMQHALPSLTRKLVTAAIIASAPLWILYAYMRDLDYATSTGPLLAVLEAYGPNTTYQLGFNPPQCGPFTAGNLMLVGAYPNRWLQAPGPITAPVIQPYVLIECPTPGTLTFRPHSGAPGQPLAITFGH